MFRSILVVSLSLILFSGCATLNQKNGATDLDAAPEPALSLVEVIKRGDEAARSSDYDAAQLNYALAVERDANNVEALYKLAFIHKIKDSLDVAEPLLHHLLSIDSDNEQAQLLLADIFLQMKKHDSAESVYKKILLVSVQSAEALNGLGVISDLRADHVVAQDYFSLALDIKPRSAKLTNNLGFSFYLEGKYVQAENSFHDALGHDSGYARAWANLALLYSRTGRRSEAEAAFRKIVSDHQAANNLGYLGIIEGDRQAAIEHLTRAIDISPVYYDRANQNLKLIQ